MITLTGILIVLGIIAGIRINKKCRSLKIPFDLDKGNFLEFITFIYGFAAALVATIKLIVTYLP